VVGNLAAGRFRAVYRRSNANILNFGRSLSTYHYHILLFLTFNTEQLPFPFSDWNETAKLELLGKQ